MEFSIDLDKDKHENDDEHKLLKNEVEIQIEDLLYVNKRITKEYHCILTPFNISNADFYSIKN